MHPRMPDIVWKRTDEKQLSGKTLVRVIPYPRSTVGFQPSICTNILAYRTNTSRTIQYEYQAAGSIVRGGKENKTRISNTNQIKCCNLCSHSECFYI